MLATKDYVRFITAELIPEYNMELLPGEEQHHDIYS